ncbi:MAG: Ig-like domain-containing protein [Proteobacteria bacterium]|nr:Ig-like domain-containing protein [Pseudomonadota bacterium]
MDQFSGGGSVEVATAVASVILSAIGETTSVTSANEAPSAIEVLTAADVDVLYRAALATMQTMRGSALGVGTGAEGEPFGTEGGDSGQTPGDGAEAEPAASEADIEAFAAAIADLFAALADELSEEEAGEEDLPENLADSQPDSPLPNPGTSLPDKARNDPPAAGAAAVGNAAPTAVADNVTIAENSAGVAIAVPANDTDANGDALTITAIDTTGLHGIATIVAGEIFYQTNGAFDALEAGDTAIDTLTYTVSDGNGGASTATVTVTITGVDDPAPVSGDVAIVTAPNGDAFLQGSFIELGVSNNGTLGTTTQIPVSFESDDHTGSIGLSFFFNLDGVGDGTPQSGDAFLPGSPVETLALAFTDGVGSFLSSNHNAGGFNGVPLAFESASAGAEGTSVVSSGGVAERMGVVQTITLDGENSYYTTTVTLTNLGDDAMTDIRYMRNNDPDHDVDSGGSFNTLNDVLSNPGAGSIAAVNAQGVFGGQNLMLLADQAALNAANNLAADTIEVRTSAFGFENTNPFAVQAFDNPADPNGASGDIGINIVFAIDSLAAGQSVTFSWITSANGTTGGGDVIMALTGQTTLDGGAGDDRIYASQAAVEETLIGGAGDDILVGLGTAAGSGDVLLGGEGLDTLIGSDGRDVLAGGLGADSFVYDDADGLFTVAGNTSYATAGGTPDTVTDFVSGTDSLRFLQAAFAGMALGSLTNGIGFSVIAGSYDGSNAGVNLNHGLGQASFIYSQSDHTLFFDSNGSGAGYQAVADIDQMAAGDIQVVAHA